MSNNEVNFILYFQSWSLTSVISRVVVSHNVVVFILLLINKIQHFIQTKGQVCQAMTYLKPKPTSTNKDDMTCSRDTFRQLLLDKPAVEWVHESARSFSWARCYCSRSRHMQAEQRILRNVFIVITKKLLLRFYDWPLYRLHTELQQ